MKSQEKSDDTHYLVLYFQVHQPRRLQAVNFLDLPNEPGYFNDGLNESIVRWHDNNVTHREKQS